MTTFVQLHLLTSYPPSNLNRDDTGRPKTASVGNATRLRISSQSLKRAWRTSAEFESSMAGHLGVRTKRMGKQAYEDLIKAGVAEKPAREWAKAIAEQFGKPKNEKNTKNDEDLEIEQLAHISPEERTAVDTLVAELARRNEKPTEEELKLLSQPRQAVDIAMFGRMLANSPDFNMDAAVQVAHAFTVHSATVEDDYFSAVDDLNKQEDTGASHIGERGYGAGLFYLYLCINRDLLIANLGNSAALADRALAALVNAVTKVAPTGMQNSFGSRAYASFVLAEKGCQQPRSLSQAFLKPVKPRDDETLLHTAATAMTQCAQNFDAVYGACADARYKLDAEAPEGTLEGLVQFVQG